MASFVPQRKWNFDEEEDEYNNLDVHAPLMEDVIEQLVEQHDQAMRLHLEKRSRPDDPVLEGDPMDINDQIRSKAAEAAVEAGRNGRMKAGKRLTLLNAQRQNERARERPARGSRVIKLVCLLRPARWAMDIITNPLPGSFT